MGTANQNDLIKTTEWSLLCLKNTKTGLAFELKNLQTKRSHQLIFSGAGMSNIMQKSLWTSGIYSQNFSTNYPVNFESFNNNLAVLKPSEGYNKNFHAFTIGWLATVNLNQSHGDGFGMWDLYGNCRVEYGTGTTIAPVGSPSRGGRIASLAVDPSDPIGAGKPNFSDLSVMMTLEK